MFTAGTDEGTQLFYVDFDQNDVRQIKLEMDGLDRPISVIGEFKDQVIVECALKKETVTMKIDGVSHPVEQASIVLGKMSLKDFFSGNEKYEYCISVQ